MNRSLLVIADDYGLSPGVNDGILALLEQKRISGTGCMTVFPGWEDDAAQLAPFAGKAMLGLHLVLTDQPALRGGSALTPNRRLPSFRRLVAGLALRTIVADDVIGELDAQLDRFRQAFGRDPDFVDGHQHVHFLRCVRGWMQATFASPTRPWLRGGPLRSRQAKAVAIAALARGFDSGMQEAGFSVMGPLAGIYDWRRPEDFEGVLTHAIQSLPDGAVFMCHPGRVDATLIARDAMTDARPVELETLLSDGYADALSAAAIDIASPVS